MSFLYFARLFLSKLFLWGFITGLLYSVCALSGAEKLLPAITTNVTTLEVDISVLLMWAMISCLAVTELYLTWQLRKLAVVADMKSVLMTGFSLMTLLTAAVVLMSKLFVRYGMYAMYNTTLPPVHPTVLKCLMGCTVSMLSVFYGRIKRIVFNPKVAFKILFVLGSLWTVTVGMMTWGFLHFRFYTYFSQVHTLEKVKHVNYTPLLFISFVLALTLDILMTRREPAVVFLHPPPPQPTPEHRPRQHRVFHNLPTSHLTM